ncbi:MAG: oxidoreductase [Nocardioides sp.]|nr:oxidoreductase [Nocardioides sp.]
MAGTIEVGGDLTVNRLGFGAIRITTNRPAHELAQRYNVNPRQVGLAWLLARSPSIMPIPGTGSVSHLEGNVAAAAIRLTPTEVASVTGNAG